MISYRLANQHPCLATVKTPSEDRGPADVIEDDLASDNAIYDQGSNGSFCGPKDFPKIEHN